MDVFEPVCNEGWQSGVEVRTVERRSSHNCASVGAGISSRLHALCCAWRSLAPGRQLEAWGPAASPRQLLPGACSLSSLSRLLGCPSILLMARCCQVHRRQAGLQLFLFHARRSQRLPQRQDDLR